MPAPSVEDYLRQAERSERRLAAVRWIAGAVVVLVLCGVGVYLALNRVEVGDESAPDTQAFLSPLGEVEKKQLGNVYFITKLRLSCQACVTGGDVVVEIPDAAKARP
jgi:hypothetical protein